MYHGIYSKIVVEIQMEVSLPKENMVITLLL